MKVFILSLFLVAASTTFAQPNCVQTAGEIQPQLSVDARRDLETKLVQARANFEKNPSLENSIWLGRRTAYLGRYKEAIGIYSD